MYNVIFGLVGEMEERLSPNSPHPDVHFYIRINID